MALIKLNNQSYSSGSAFLPTGSVLQVQNTYNTSNSFTTSATSYSDCGLSVNITPTSSSNKILILVNVMMQTTAGSNSYSGVTTIRGAFGSGTSLQEYYFGSASGGNSNELYSINTIDEPSTTSSQQYTIAIRKSSSATTSVSTDGGLYEIILMEIQG